MAGIASNDLGSRRVRRRAVAAVVGALVVVVVVLACVACRAVRPPGRGDEPPAPADGDRLTSAYEDLVADQGNSVPLPDGRMLWIFADTAQTTASPRFFVTSSAAVAERDGLSLRFLTDGAGRPVEFLPRTPSERRATTAEGYVAVWPTGATVLPDGRILVAYATYRVRSEPTRFEFLAGGLYAYTYRGTAPGTGGVTGDEPAQRVADGIWQPDDGPVASPVRAGQHVYLSRCDRRERHCYSVRVHVDRIADRDAYRWWAGTGWSPDRADRRPMHYGSDRPGRNPPTRALPERGLYVVVDTPAGIPASEGLIWVARRPWGPWSRAAGFALPGCGEQGCYTLNPHPEAAVPEGMLRVSYATAGSGPHVKVVDVPIEIGPDGAWVRTGRPG
jgi:hypothetical protein